MARTTKKTTRKASTTRKGTATQLPKGYEAITGFADSWPNEDTKVGDMIEGTLSDFDEVKTKNRKEPTQVCTLTTKEGKAYRLWESAGLRPLFEYEEGTKAAVIYDGLGPKQRGKNPMKLFRIGVK